ncbi:MAG: type IV secretory system conjugative DNA transfer family protein [Actinomycetota bacterium]|nr:type IV secretory system conjugative DNA transfer family protein [Actinomycetota bacterium]
MKDEKVAPATFPIAYSRSASGSRSPSIIGGEAVWDAGTDYGLLIGGPPRSGKTSVLRQLVLQTLRREAWEVRVADPGGEVFGGLGEPARSRRCKAPRLTVGVGSRAVRMVPAILKEIWLRCDETSEEEERSGVSFESWGEYCAVLAARGEEPPPRILFVMDCPEKFGPPIRASDRFACGDDLCTLLDLGGSTGVHPALATTEPLGHYNFIYATDAHLTLSGEAPGRGIWADGAIRTNLGTTISDPPKVETYPASVEDLLAAARATGGW